MKKSCSSKSFCSNLSLRLITSFFGFIIISALFFYLPPLYLILLFAGISIWILLVEWPALLRTSSKTFFFITPLYPLFPLATLLALASSPIGTPLLAWTIVIVCIHDGSAFIAGKLLGKHPLAKKISPYKTIEGCLGGFTGVVLAQLLFFARPGTKLAETVALAALVSIIATSGDLLESFFKRQAGVKDSGTILPGHGGLLDRLDALLFLAPCVYLFMPVLYDVVNVSLFVR